VPPRRADCPSWLQSMPSHGPGLAAVLAVAVVLLGCGSRAVRGAAVLPAGQEPTAVWVVAYTPAGCADYSGAPAEYRAQLFLIQSTGGRRLLVEARSGYDSLVIHNSYVDGSELVFQVALERLLREIRVPTDGAGRGWMVFSRSWAEQELPDGGWRATPKDAVLTCALEPRPAAAPTGPRSAKLRLSGPKSRQSGARVCRGAGRDGPQTARRRLTSSLAGMDKASLRGNIPGHGSAGFPFRPARLLR
jgi:hypothetical protein